MDGKGLKRGKKNIYIYIYNTFKLHEKTTNTLAHYGRNSPKFQAGLRVADHPSRSEEYEVLSRLLRDIQL